jgi:hypothetical protein
MMMRIKKDTYDITKRGLWGALVSRESSVHQEASKRVRKEAWRTTLISELSPLNPRPYFSKHLLSSIQSTIAEPKTSAEAQNEKFKFFPDIV